MFIYFADAEVGNPKYCMCIILYMIITRNSHISVLFLQGSGRTRDSSGEPLATSYHSMFMGTVDYIWYEKQLCTKFTICS